MTHFMTDEYKRPFCNDEHQTCWDAMNVLAVIVEYLIRRLLAELTTQSHIFLDSRLHSHFRTHSIPFFIFLLDLLVVTVHVHK